MNIRASLMIIILCVLTPLSGIFAAWEKNKEKTSSSNSSLTWINDGSGVISTEPTYEIGSKKSVKKNLVAKWDKEKSVNDSSGDTFSEEDKDKVQQEINNYILEAYKLQWNKILKDIDASLQRINPDVETRIQAYDHIQKTLAMREKRIQAMALSENNKTILTAYLDYMIQSLEKRQAELKN